MTTLICSIAIAINLGKINILTNAAVEGKLLSQSSTKYLIDFSDGVRKYDDLAGKPEDYSKVLVNKTDCVQSTK